MQSNIKIDDKKLSDRIEKFKNDKYPHLSITRLFVHALVELMKREE